MNLGGVGVGVEHASVEVVGLGETAGAGRNGGRCGRRHRQSDATQVRRLFCVLCPSVHYMYSYTYLPLIRNTSAYILFKVPRTH